MPNWKKVIIKDSAAELASLDTSGNISASGDIFANSITLANGSGIVYADEIAGPSLTLDSAGQVRIDSAGSTINFSKNNTDLLRLIPGSDSADFIGNITASGNISSSGTVVGSNLSGNNTGDSTITDSVTTTSSTIRASATAVKAAKDAAYANTILISNQQSLNTIQTNAILANESNIALKANIASPALTGVPEAPTATANTNTTQIATTAYTDAAVAALVDSAPANLNTLNELAEALNDDDDAIVTINTALGTKLPLAGGNMSGPIDMGNQNITAVKDVKFTNLIGAGSVVEIGLEKFKYFSVASFAGNRIMFLEDESAQFGSRGSATTTIGKSASNTSTAGGILNIHAGDTAQGGTSDIAGGHLNIRGGKGKGTGAGGEIVLWVSPSTTTGNLLNTSYPALTINQDRSAEFAKNVSIDGIMESVAVSSPTITTGTAQSRSKLMLWSGTTYAIGMKQGYTFGGLNNDYAMSFQMNNDADRGFWWGHDSHTDAQGAMALTTDGRLSVAQFLRLGYGETDTAIPGTHSLDVSGDIFLTGDVIGQTTKERWIKNVAYVVVAGSTEQFIPLVGAAENPNEANGSSAMVMPTGGKLLKVHLRSNRNLHQLSGTSTANNITVKMHTWSPGTTHSQTTEVDLGAVTGVGPSISAVAVYDFTGTLDSGIGTPTNAFAAGDLLGFGIKHSQNMAENTKYFVTLVFEMDWESY
jgi:hypothetical protein